MKAPDRDYRPVQHTRAAFLEKHAITTADTTLVDLTYDGDDYRRYRTVKDHDKGSGMIRPGTHPTDALVTTDPGHALFLPLADCIGAVLYDPTKSVLMLSHLGRHNLEQHGGTHSVDYLVTRHTVNPSDLEVWLSPAAGKEHYPLFAFEHKSLHDVALSQLRAAGVPSGNITVSPINSAANPDYFSHSQFLKGNQETDGRFAVVALFS